MVSWSISKILALFPIIFSVFYSAIISNVSSDRVTWEPIPMSYNPVAIDTGSQAYGTAWPIVLGYAVTSNHVVSDTDHATLVTDSGVSISAQVVARDVENDLAILSVSDPEKLPAILPRAAQTVAPGDHVFTMGYRRDITDSVQLQLSYGIVSSDEIEVEGSSSDAYRVSVVVQPGNSGSPVLNMHGEVIGLVSASMGTVKPSGDILLSYPHTTYVSRVDALRKLVEYLPRRGIIGTYTKSDVRSLDSLAERIRHSVMQVVVR